MLVSIQQAPADGLALLPSAFHSHDLRVTSMRTLPTLQALLHRSSLETPEPHMSIL